MNDDDHQEGTSMHRRKFLRISSITAGLAGGFNRAAAEMPESPQQKSAAEPEEKFVLRLRRPYNTEYKGTHNNQVAFPLGGIGAGMVCLEGTGALSHVSLRNRPEMFNEPCVFAAVAIKGKPEWARVLEGPVPARKIFGRPGTAMGDVDSTYGLPRFTAATFRARFPSGIVKLEDPDMPVQVEITGWSPFEPGDADNASLPVAALEYRLTNSSSQPLAGVFSYNARNFMAAPPAENPKGVRPIEGGFTLWGGATKDHPWEEGAFSATVSEPGVKVNHAWFRSGWWDALTMAWKDVEEAACYDRAPVAEGTPSPGGSLFVPFELAAGASKTIVVRLAWYVGQTNMHIGLDLPGAAPTSPTHHRPWYAGRFADINEVSTYWRGQYDKLRAQSFRFSDCFYDSSLPPEVLEAVAANLTILKSPTVMRQTDGRFWAWEGCYDDGGCCPGSCTHVWNYAQALPHLFPSLERTLRETEFGPSQNEAGHQTFRSGLPIRPVDHEFHAAADGQLGGIMKVYRDWRISGDTDWLRKLWPQVKSSLNYCITTWDPEHRGVVEEPHHNTYDIEFWGADGMCTSFYLGALQAAVIMGKAMGDEMPLHAELLARGAKVAETSLFNGDYFFQKIDWKGLHAKTPLGKGGGMNNSQYPSEAAELLEKEGPKYQYGTGCLSDGVLGSWMAMVCGVGQVLDRKKVTSHLKSVHTHNLKHDLSKFANPQRPGYACGSEGGLLLCTWPKGGKLSLPFVYSNEVWTGIEYQVASHLMLMGQVEHGLDIVRTCRDRYDGAVRNPFNEYECGHWYARAMSSYALLFGLGGARYDAVDKVLYLEPRIKGDFHCFLSTATGYGTVGVKNGKPFYTDVSGKLAFSEIKYTPAA
ncbi:MAG: GH116 family glycosyl hydrolase [Luteolibacter sp.]